MNIYVWRHNKTYHSHSMIDEPCVNSEFYRNIKQKTPTSIGGK